MKFTTTTASCGWELCQRSSACQSAFLTFGHSIGNVMHVYMLCRSVARSRRGAHQQLGQTPSLHVNCLTFDTSHNVQCSDLAEAPYPTRNTNVFLVCAAMLSSTHSVQAAFITSSKVTE